MRPNERAVDVAGAAKVLGISDEQVRSLMEAGVLVPADDPAADPDVDMTELRHALVAARQRRSDDSLVAAWGAVEQALPKGWTFAIEKSGDAWYAYAEPIQPMDEWDERGVNAMEETPTAVLRALAASLIEISETLELARVKG